MPARQTGPADSAPEPLRTRVKRAALGVLFGLILVIPRLRRLRRRVWTWSIVRVLAGVLGLLLLERFARAGAGPLSLVSGILLIVFSALVRARPQGKSIDDVRRQAGALIVLNGGTLHLDEGARPVPGVSILVHTDKLTVLTARQ